MSFTLPLISFSWSRLDLTQSSLHISFFAVFLTRAGHPHSVSQTTSSGVLFWAVRSTFWDPSSFSTVRHNSTFAEGGSPKIVRLRFEVDALPRPYCAGRRCAGTFPSTRWSEVRQTRPPMLRPIPNPFTKCFVLPKVSEVASPLSAKELAFSELSKN